MTDRQIDTMRALRYHTDQGIEHSWHRKWASPMDVGGYNGSHHGSTLFRLAKMGLAEAEVHRVGERRVFKYRISDKGREFLAGIESEAIK